MTGELYHLLSLFVTEDDSHSSTVQYFSKAVDFIKNNYFSYSLTVESIADFLKINRSYLYTIFKDTCGMSPKDYLTNFRIQQAKSLLIHSQLNIASISSSVGYEDNM